MKYHTLFFRKLGKLLQNLSSATIVIGALRVYLVKKSADDIKHMNNYPACIELTQ